MGVRESVGQSGSDETRLHDLVIREKKREELPFDPEKDITDEQWQKAKRRLERAKELEMWDHFARDAMRMKILFPERVAELNLDNEVWQKMKKRRESFFLGRIKEWGLFFEEAAEAKILFPERVSELELDEGIYEEGKKGIEALSKKGELAYLLNLVTNIKILFPEKSSELSLNEEIWKKIEEQAQKWYEENNWGMFSGWAASIKICCPTKMARFNLNDRAWSGMKQESKEIYDSEDAQRKAIFLSQMMNMKILAAKEARITEQGIECTMPSGGNFKEEKPDLPVRKRF